MVVILQTIKLKIKNDKFNGSPRNENIGMFREYVRKIMPLVFIDDNSLTFQVLMLEYSGKLGKYHCC